MDGESNLLTEDIFIPETLSPFEWIERSQFVPDQILSQSPISVEAPYQDFTFLQSMVEFHKKDAVLSRKIIDKLSRHMWYLSEETVGLAFFDPNVKDEIKRAMVQTK